MLDYLTQRVTALHNSLLHIHISVQSHVFISRCSVAASKCGRSPSSGFSNCPLPQLPASHELKIWFELAAHKMFPQWPIRAVVISEWIVTKFDGVEPPNKNL
jgi:hypothetical protein